ncbi:MAG: methyltransferase domain-containing protein [Myxococcota bacterium]
MMSEPPRPLVDLTREELSALTRSTLWHYQQHAEDFREGTQDHDVSQNIDALLRHVPGPPPQRILDLGCGPGRDLATFVARGHEPVGLDGAAAFVAMARAATGCEVWHQDFLALDLPPERFDGIFANAVLFHVPTQELGRVLGDLRQTLITGGVLFCSNPRGPDVEGQQGLRYGSYLTLHTWSRFVTAAGFEPIEHYFRPPGRPRAEQPWLATVWRACEHANS